STTFTSILSANTPAIVVTQSTTVTLHRPRPRTEPRGAPRTAAPLWHDPSPAQAGAGTVFSVARYDVPTPSTLLLRGLAPHDSANAQHLLDLYVPDPLLEHALVRASDRTQRVFTLADVAASPDATPVAAAVVVTRPDSPGAWLTRFAVDLPLRRRGLGRRLLTELATVLRAEGRRDLVARISAGPDPVLGLLRAGGFVISPRIADIPWSQGLPTGEDGPSWQWWVLQL
ncbi:MAG TPA: GNAT family N-acetyltransferase, partial [Micromonosporaceae bacterium]